MCDVSVCRYKDAAGDCTSALRLDSSNQKARLRRARCYVELRQFEQALRDFDQGLVDMRAANASADDVKAGTARFYKPQKGPKTSGTEQ